VWVTQDDGKHWNNVTPPGLKPGGRVQNIEPGPHQAGTAYVAIYRYLLGDFAPYIYATKDFGKTWKLLTDGTNGIAADEPTRVVREDPDRPGLLYAGTEFGMYISFDDGAKWTSFQMNLPASPVTDIKIGHGDLVLSTQGRSFWILDNLTPLHQLKASSTPVLYAPRQAVRTPGGGGGGGLRQIESGAPEYPRAGAMIDYYLPSAMTGELKINILDKNGKVIRTLSSVAAAGGRGGRRGGGGGGGAAPAAGGDEQAAAAAAIQADEEGGGFRGAPPVVLETTAGMHRVTWDLRTIGGWVSDTAPIGNNGPVIVPGDYKVQMVAGDVTLTQPLHVIEDPRITKDGVTTADLQEQYDHNVKVLALVDDMNKDVARLKKGMADKTLSADKAAKLQELSMHVITPAIRYSQPELQTQVTYLLSVTSRTDQKIGRDAIEQYQKLRKQVDDVTAQLNAILGAA
jgi:hypothetical protein